MKRNKFIEVLAVVFFGLWIISAVPIIVFLNSKAMEMSMGETLTQVTIYVFAFAWMLPLGLLIKEVH
jgi:hypothetical protein